MTALVKLRFGDIFEGPADVIVLPCSTGGTVTDFVYRKLAYHSIPEPLPGMELGEVEIMPFEGGERFAQYVAFAASVGDMDSAPEAIEAIGRALGDFTAKNEGARVVAAPMLGAGSGGLRHERVVKALKSGFTETADRNATLVIHILERDVFARLKSAGSSNKSSSRPAVRVFISHTSTSEESSEWVKRLALFLMDRGVQARLDRFHLRRGMDLPQWMCNELSLADRVVIVCDEAYKQKADGRMGGVGWETMIIQGDLASLPPDSTKYQIVVRDEEIGKGVPVYLKTRFAFHAPPSDTKQRFREELLRELLDLPLDDRLAVDETVL